MYHALSECGWVILDNDSGFNNKSIICATLKSIDFQNTFIGVNF